MRNVIIALLLAGCTQFPELDATVDPDLQDAPFPALVPLGPILSRSQELPNIDGSVPDLAANIDARISRLRARAATLRGPVISSASRARMRRGVDTTALQ